MAFLLNKKLKYSQDRALLFAAMNDQQSLVKFLLNRSQLKPSQSGINTAIKSAASYGKKNMVEFLLNWEEQPQPDPEVINWALCSATSKNQITTVEYLLNKPGEKFKFNQYGINASTVAAARFGHQAIINLLLNRPEGQLRPDQDGIINAYREAVANNYVEIIRLLTPLVPPEEWQYQVGPNRGLAYEIHNYTDTEIINNESSTSDTKPIKLIDAVWDHINIQLKGITIIAYNEAESTIKQAIEEFIPKSKQELATQAVLHRLGSDADYEHRLSVAVTFIQIFRKDKMNQWIEGFVRESIEAYNSSNSTSCAKGIRERVATGFRGIDHELDKIFSHAEAPMLMRNWLKTWDLLSIKDEAKQTLAKQLISHNITEDSSSEDVAKIFKAIATKELQDRELHNNAESKAEIEIYTESMVEANYEVILKPFVKAELSKTL